MPAGCLRLLLHAHAVVVTPVCVIRTHGLVGSAVPFWVRLYSLTRTPILPLHCSTFRLPAGLLPHRIYATFYHYTAHLQLVTTTLAVTACTYPAALRLRALRGYGYTRTFAATTHYWFCRYTLYLLVPAYRVRFVTAAFALLHFTGLPVRFAAAHGCAHAPCVYGSYTVGYAVLRFCRIGCTQFCTPPAPVYHYGYAGYRFAVCGSLALPHRSAVTVWFALLPTPLRWLHTADYVPFPIWLVPVRCLLQLRVPQHVAATAYVRRGCGLFTATAVLPAHTRVRCWLFYGCGYYHCSSFGSCG